MRLRLLHRRLLHARLLHARLLHARLLHARLLHARLLHARLLHARLLHRRLLHARLLHRRLLHGLSSWLLHGLGSWLLHGRLLNCGLLGHSRQATYGGRQQQLHVSHLALEVIDDFLLPAENHLLPGKMLFMLELGLLPCLQRINSSSNSL
jgi:hypothetical protein